MILPPVTQEYKPEIHNVVLNEIQKSDGQNLKLDKDNFIETGSIVLKAYDGGKWFKLRVSNAGTFSVSELTGTQLDASGRPVLASSNPYVT